MEPLQLSELAVMLVEPSSTQRRIVTDYLQNLGISNVEPIADGAHALESIRQHRPDLVISALYLNNDTTGTDLLHQLRQDEMLECTAFMLISSETRFRYLDPIRQAGVTAILPKPFTLDELQIALKSTLDYIDPANLELCSFDPENIEVLIVDDSRMARNHIRRVLSKMGLENFSEAENGVEAIKLIDNQFFDLVVTDYNMPEMDGGELVDQIRHQSNQASIPILMVTSEENVNRLASVQQAGVSAICDKPFESSTIKKLLEQLFS